MFVEAAITFAVAFVVIAFGSYAGAKMALRSFFGEEFTDAETGTFTLPEAVGDESIDETE